MAKTFIVVWVEKKIVKDNIIGKEFEKLTDHYHVYNDGSSTQNKRDAKSHYNDLIKMEKVYSANICEVIESTDY